MSIQTFRGIDSRSPIVLALGPLLALALWAWPGAWTVPVGTLVSLAAIYPLTTARELRAALLKACGPPCPDPHEIARHLLQMAVISRNEGLLALEGLPRTRAHPFLFHAIQLVADGLDQGTIIAMIDLERRQMASRHQQVHALLRRGAYAATGWGLASALVLNASGPMVVGLALAGTVLLPLEYRLRRLGEAEWLWTGIVASGVVAIQSGDNPLIVREKLLRHLGHAPFPELVVPAYQSRYEPTTQPEWSALP
jgi:chemotaxis protein MotA